MRAVHSNSVYNPWLFCKQGREEFKMFYMLATQGNDNITELPSSAFNSMPCVDTTMGQMSNNPKAWCRSAGRENTTGHQCVVVAGHPGDRVPHLRLGPLRVREGPLRHRGPRRVLLLRQDSRGRHHLPPGHTAHCQLCSSQHCNLK